MGWFDGTYTWSKEELEKRYPNRLTEDLRQSANGMELALINQFREGDPLLDLADPKADEDEYGKVVFFHVFTGEDAGQARTAFAYYYDMECHLYPEYFMLLRQDEDRLFQYGYGHVCRPLLDRQEELRQLLPKDLDRDQDIFMLPLKRHMFPCPVCWERTLPYRGDYIICPECGWEDDGTDRIDEITGPNGDYTIMSYRQKYLREKGRVM